MTRDRSDRPNVLVLLTDQQRWDTTGVHGNPMDLTPNFDRMAANGTHLNNFFTCEPVCGPARSCLQTGLYASQTGVWRNGIALDKGVRTLAHYFRETGYTTGYIGKWHLDIGKVLVVPESSRGGYEYWLASNHLEVPSEAYKTVLFDNDDQPITLPGYRADAVTDAAIRYLDQHQNDSFFLFVSILEPHHQDRLNAFVAPDGYRERYTGGWVPPDLAALVGSTYQHLADYYGCVKRVDEALGRLLDGLKSLGVLDNTIVLYLSDHGCHFQTRNAEHKRSGHESSIRVPGALRGPGFDGGGQVGQLVSLVDIAPTLLDAVGIPVPEHMQGRSILPLLRGQSEQWPDEVFVQICESQVGRAVRTQRWKYGVQAPDKDGWSDPCADRYVEEYLYDLELDPYELNNLVGLDSHREVADIMRERLMRRMTEAGETLPEIEAAPTRSFGGPRTQCAPHRILEEEARA